MKLIPLNAVVTILLVYNSCLCQSQNIFVDKNVVTTLFSEARLENIEAVSKEGQSVFNAETGEVLFKVKIKSFHFQNGLMEEHFNETYLESDKYPFAQFKGTIAEKIDPLKNGEIHTTAQGTFTLHGVSDNRSCTGVVSVKEGKIHLTSEFLVSVSVYKINIPHDKISNISQDIKVTVTANYSIHVKK